MRVPTEVGAEVVALCGSMRFRAEFQRVNRELVLKGAVVLAPDVFDRIADVVDGELKSALDRGHRVKIALADRVVVVAPGGYVGESTAGEISYAVSIGKPVEYRDPTIQPDDTSLVVSVGYIPDRSELASLYDSVGWSSYTQNLEQLEQGVRNSLRVVTARVGGRLVGLARVVGDGATIIYLQDVLVAPDHRREGLGRRLVEAAFSPFQHVRQQVLLTDDEPAQRTFYETLGFTEIRDYRPGSLRAFVRFR